MSKWPESRVGALLARQLKGTLGPGIHAPTVRGKCIQAFNISIHLQGYLAYMKLPTPLGLPYGPRHSPTVGS